MTTSDAIDRAKRAYVARRKAEGLMQVSVWVPPAHKDIIQRVAAALRGNDPPTLNDLWNANRDKKS